MPRRYEDIGIRLVRVREALGISQADVCRAIDVKASRYSQYETGDRQITVAVARRLRRKYGITLDYIYEDDPSALPAHLIPKVHRAA